jgi:cysteine synthase
MHNYFLPSFSDYHLGNTPLYCAGSYCKSKNLFIKLEQHNPLGSIKDRTAYFIIRDLINTGKLQPGVKLVESSSGNLGLALGYFAREIGVDFLCLVDPTIPNEKIRQLESKHVKLHTVSLGNYKTYRDARINMATELDLQPDWIWTRQYDSISNVMSHYETTGQEIWQQTKQKVDFAVCSTGTGGTICGIGLYLKEMNPAVEIIAVEPLGSTIFGGIPGCYLSAGSGMSCASSIVQKYGHVIDCFAQVPDEDALNASVQFMELEKISLGVTAGAALVVASKIAIDNPEKNVVAVAPDGGSNYTNLFETYYRPKHGNMNSILIYPLKDK